MRKTGNIEDIYPLSPMQEGILFHALYTPETMGYFEQFSYTLEGDLNMSVFEQAWQTIVARHPILRTLFAWEKQNQPLQIVRQKVTVPFTYQDWRPYPPAEQQAKLEAFLISDRKQGFNLSKAPLMRLTLMRLSEQRYQFTWSFHHLLLDGWSGPIVWSEFFILYEGLCRAESPMLPDRRPYRDYIRWLQQQDLTQAERFWRDYLKGFTEPTPFGVDQPNSRKQSEVYAKQELVLPEVLTASLQQLAQKHRLTISTLIQGVWAITLSRYSNESEVVFGTTVSGRAAPLREIENMVGLFINTLPLRVQVTPEVSVVESLQALQRKQTERRLYEHSPLTQIQQWSGISANMSLFESILVLANYPMPQQTETEQHSLTIRDVRAFEQTNYPLTVLVRPGTQLLWRLQYDCNRFDDETISRMLGNIQTLLEYVVTKPKQRLSELSILTQTEQHKLLVEWNNTQTNYPRHSTIHQLFEAQVERTPDAIAVIDPRPDDETPHHLTYGELNRRANQIANYLGQFDLGSPGLVCLYLDRSYDMIAAILGVLKAGGAYVPLDPIYPQARLALLLEDIAQATPTDKPIVITQPELVGNLPPQAVNTVCLHYDQPKIVKFPDTNPPPYKTAHDTAYVLYTSGSTGTPKGVCCHHQGVINLLSDFENRQAIRPGDSCSWYTSISFDVSVYEIFSALLYGGKLYIVPEETRADRDHFIALLAELQIQNAYVPPFMVAKLADKSKQPLSGLALRRLLVGVEPIPEPLLSTISKNVPGLCVINGYGPTEATICATLYNVPDSLGPKRNTPIGRAVQNMQIYLLDPYGQLVPLGVQGEIYIGGVGVAHGYLNRPDLTSERFIADPFSPQTEARLYKTGDMARYLPDGNIQFMGRTDFQLKIRGFRIEAGEIEAVLGCHPAVQEGVVLAREDNSGERHLVAYIVSKQDPGPTVDELRSFLGKTLPDYMVPSAFMMLETIPLTPNGKIDHKALPEAGPSRPTLVKSYVAPKTEIEQTIATIWQEVLGLDKVGRHDNFFDLGGHSLRMVQVHSKLKAHFDQDLPMVKLFEYPTIAAMAQFFGQGQNEASDSLSKQRQIQDRAARQKKARTRKRHQRKLRRNQG